MISNIYLNEILEISVCGFLGYQLNGYVRGTQTTDDKKCFIDEWFHYMKLLNSELKTVSRVEAKEVLDILRTKANGVYECYVTWVERDGVFTGMNY